MSMTPLIINQKMMVIGDLTMSMFFFFLNLNEFEFFKSLNGSEYKNLNDMFIFF